MHLLVDSILYINLNKNNLSFVVSRHYKKQSGILHGYTDIYMYVIKNCNILYLMKVYTLITENT